MILLSYSLILNLKCKSPNKQIFPPIFLIQLLTRKFITWRRSRNELSRWFYCFFFFLRVYITCW